MVKPRVLLDTTYLLPVFGVGIGLEGYEDKFPRLLEEFYIHYSPLSLIEAKWIILKLSKINPNISRRLLAEYRRGLEVVISDDRLRETITTNSVIEEVADHLLELGLRDYFDRMIYATAYYYDAMLLTEDKELKTINEKTPYYRLPRVIDWAEVKGLLGK